MTTRASMIRWLATTLVALATLGMSGIAAASNHGGGGGGGGGSHGGGGSSGGGHAAAHVGHGSSFSGTRGGFHGPAGGYRAPATGYRGPGATQVSHGWNGGLAPSRPIGANRAITASRGHTPWGRPGWGGGYYGRYPYYHPYYGFVGWLPPYYATYWWGGVPYYFADDTYYLWDANVGQYQVVPPPPAAEESSSAADSGDLYVYPNSGQSPEQQSADRYECHRWASDQTGFNPTKPNGGVSPESAAQARDAYRRAEGACLTGRGYSVQ